MMSFDQVWWILEYFFSEKAVKKLENTLNHEKSLEQNAVCERMHFIFDIYRYGFAKCIF